MVGVDRPMKALSMYIQKPYKGKIVKVLIAVILSKFIFSELNSLMHMFNVSILSRQYIKLLHQKLGYKLIGPWRHDLCIYKSLISEKLSNFSQLSFCQKLFFLNQTPSCICSMCLHCKGKVSNCSIKSCGRS